MLFKLDAEIRDLQNQAGFKRKVDEIEKAKKSHVAKKMVNGPMRNAMIEYDKRREN